MTADNLRLAVVQPRVIRPNEEANVERAVAYVSQAAQQGARIVALPECYPGPYGGPASFCPDEHLLAVAAAYEIYVGYGLMVRADDRSTADGDVYYNVYRVAGPQGNVAAEYHKVIPSPVDSELANKQLAAGDTLVTFDTPWAKVGLLICWEAWFPELCRMLAMRGIDLVLFPTGGMLYHLSPVWHNIIQARATENLIYTAACVNLFGIEDGFAHICGPEGEIVSSREEGILVADLDLARLRYLRQEEETLRFPKFYKTIPGLWRHARPDLYRLNT